MPLWRASWPRLVRRALSGAVTFGAPVGFREALAPFPTPGAFAAGFTGQLHGASGGRPGTGLLVPAAGPCRGRGAELAPRHTLSGPCNGVVPGGSIQRLSWPACSAVVCVQFPVPFIFLLGTRPVHRGCFLWTPTPCGSEDATPGSPVCVRVRALFGRVGRAGLAGVFWWASPCLWLLCPSTLLGPLRAGVALCLTFCLPSFFFFFFTVSKPPCLLLSLASGCGCPGLGAVSPPPPLPVFFSPFFLVACLVSCLFPPALLFLLAPRSPFFRFFVLLRLSLPFSPFWLDLWVLCCSALRVLLWVPRCSCCLSRCPQCVFCGCIPCRSVFRVFPPLLFVSLLVWCL